MLVYIILHPDIYLIKKKSKYILYSYLYTYDEYLSSVQKLFLKLVFVIIYLCILLKPIIMNVK